MVRLQRCRSQFDNPRCNVWFPAPTGTITVPSGGSPNNRKNKIIYTLDTNNTGEWTINFEGQEKKAFEQDWGGLAGIYLALKPSNNKDDSIAIYSAKIYETEKYKEAETAALAAYLRIINDKLTILPDAVVDDLKTLPASVGGKISHGRPAIRRLFRRQAL